MSIVMDHHFGTGGSAETSAALARRQRSIVSTLKRQATNAFPWDTAPVAAERLWDDDGTLADGKPTGAMFGPASALWRLVALEQPARSDEGQAAVPNRAGVFP